MDALYIAAANIDKLFSNAIEVWKFELNPNKNNDDLKDRHILYAPMKYQECIIPVKITVKEYKSQEIDNKLYSVEVIIDINLIKMKKGVLGTLTADAFDKEKPDTFYPSKTLLMESTGSVKLLFSKRLPYLFDNVNNYLEKSKSTTRRKGMRLMIKRRDMRVNEGVVWGRG
jgi:hypothetical protein